MNSDAIVQRELQSSFNWSCRMTLNEFNDLCRTFRKLGFRMEPHEELDLPMTAISIGWSLEGTWRDYKEFKHSNPNDNQPERHLCRLWEDRAIRHCSFIKTHNNADKVYDDLISNPAPNIRRLKYYLQQFQVACVSSYLKRSIPFSSYRPMITLNLE